MTTTLEPTVQPDAAQAGLRPWMAAGAVLALLLAVPLTTAAQPAGGSNGPADVLTYGSFYRYSGPLGSAINGDGSVTPAQSWFRNPDFNRSQVLQPTEPYPGYDAPAYAGTGVGQNAYLQGLVAGPRVEFWTQEDAAPPGTPPSGVNRLSIVGGVQPGVTLDPVTRKSNTFRLATISFTNGSWYGSSPTFDPGLGPLYPDATFDFDLVAQSTPTLGVPTLRNPDRHVFYGSLVLTSTFGPNTPDYLQLFDTWTMTPSFASSVLAVDEGITGSVELWGRIGSLEPMFFANASAGVQILSSLPVTPVPEPATVAMMLAGLAVVGGVARRRMG